MQVACMAGMAAATNVQPLHDISFAHGSPLAALASSDVVPEASVAGPLDEAPASPPVHAVRHVAQPEIRLVAQPAQVVVHA
jgi:hypothetical protein